MPTDQEVSFKEEITDKPQQEYKLKQIQLDKKDPTSEETPQYQQAIDLSEEQQDRLVEEILEEFQTLKKEREALGLESKWAALQAQYDGEMEDNSDQQFNVHIHTTKVKIDAIVRAAKRSFYDVEPKFAVTPRPETSKKFAENADEICQQQQDFLDYKIDEEIGLEDPLELALYSSAIKAVGILKLPWCYRREKKRREENYKASEGGLQAFLSAYPDAATKYPVLLAKLVRGEDVSVEVEYFEITKNDPEPEYVANENFYCYDYVDGMTGLKSARVTIERKFMSWRDLCIKTEVEGWKNVEEMKFAGAKPRKSKEAPDKPAELENYSVRDYKVLEINIYFNKDDSKKVSDEVKVKCWLAEDRETLLHVIAYPYYGVDSEYIPFYCKKHKAGFWKNAASIASDLSSSNMAENMFMNFMLEGAWLSNVVTPVVKEGSVTEQQLMNKRWSHGVPLVIRREASEVGKELSFVDYKKPNIGEMITVMQYLMKQDDDVSGVSSLMSGRESPTDPRAPATKTLALLKASGLNIEDYIKALLPSFNQIANILLQMYHQLSNDGVSYRTKSQLGAVVGGNPFKQIPREAMVAKTNIQSQAYAFNIDKTQEKQENLALYQVLRAELIARGDGRGLYNLVRALIKSWSPVWRTRIDQIWPSPEEFQQQQVKDAALGLAQYIQALIMKEQTTGVPAEANAEKAIDMLKQLRQAKMAGGMDIKDLGGPATQEGQVNAAMGL